MKKRTRKRPTLTRGKRTVFAQLCNFIPATWWRGWLHRLLLRFAIVDTARDNDNARARELCAGIRAGEIVIFDRADVDFAHLFGLYVLLRFHAWLHGRPHSFTRLFTLLRAVVWDRFDLPGLLEFHGTARERWRMRAQPEQGYLPGFSPMAMG